MVATIERAGQMLAPLRFPDVMTGLVAALAIQGVRVLQKDGHRLDSAFEKLFPDIVMESQSEGLEPLFCIETNQLHGDSEDLQEELVAAARRDLVSLDNPEYRTVRLKVSATDAPTYFEGVPGSRAMYERLARKFLKYYRGE